MEVHIKLFSRLRMHLPPETRGEATIQLSEDATVADLLAHLDIPGRVQFIAVNDLPETDRARILQDGDKVRIVPFVVGG